MGQNSLHGEHSWYGLSQWYFADPSAPDKNCPPCLGKQNTAPYSYISFNNYGKSSLLQWNEY